MFRLIVIFEFIKEYFLLRKIMALYIRWISMKLLLVLWCIVVEQGVPYDSLSWLKYVD